MPPADFSRLDTVVALATPFGRSAIAVVRLTGPETRRILSALAPSLSAAPEPRTPRLAELRGARGEPLDRALVTLFAAPASFTGEDVAEMSVHGSPAVIAGVIEAAIAAGARPARAGEFTERAFRSGKLDLLRAEAVGELIEARTPRAARASLARLEGALSERFRRVREDLLEAASGLAAAIDFSEDAGEEVGEQVPSRLRAAEEALELLAASYRAGRLLTAGARVAILGRPNAGKSTLFNALAGSARAIVTDVPGTTRDALEAELDLGGIPVTVVDTAGLRETDDLVESLGVARARAEAERADAIVWVYDAAEGLSEAEAAELASLDKPRVVVANKIDRAFGAIAPDAEPLCGLAEDAGARLRGWLSECVASGVAIEEASEALASLRQHELTTRARDAAAAARESLSLGDSPEYAAAHCTDALAAIADLVGDTTSEDVLARVFATFCIGK
ncbi:MAG TPA: tRNA uridine-5-carboxymethylaminomethyl(34) synthesis GTPase MnmE [Thermoanaerobaculia bacterium]|jgi:tRNA modification GTPase|nr:tRNA uridine-5-carboxymethylaminomethyl(34) synthesis GTPase MnmE [Thermoanaerobaculia bacterium]